ncbi:hypothetical protein [Microbacterium sp. SORGH_AS_0888]|uniref:hypothetical protein n=1 Tax=Microbacterium sp. SORGH_AS_0888 TaxID=3041791 RepID=UPI0027812C51|nr:hypothetical protein [Microbacterium sp. SORGH_AS_0888]MDQ1130203.1 hypothetical protein [Microbacterium sp. SORGH_AS_0888]
MSAWRAGAGAALTGVVLAAAGILVGCAGAPAPTTTTTTAMDVDAAWLDGGRLIGVVTWGSSSCVPVAASAALGADGTLAVTLEDAPASEGGTPRACTADHAPRVSLVDVPQGVDPATGVGLHVTYGAGAGETALAAAPGLTRPDTPSDNAPSAGWTGTPGMFAFVTWGSSSCVPAVKDVAATGDAQVTLTFAEPAADRVCTMDMVPRAGLAQVSGVKTASGAQLVLAGDAFAGVAVPIVGGG